MMVKVFFLVMILSWIINCSATPDQKAECNKQPADSLHNKTKLAANKISYSDVIKNILNTQQRFLDSYNKAQSQDEKNEIIKVAKKYLITAISDSLIPFWYGTPWEFYGATETPGKGSIACGYFVSTVLKHAGFKVERVRMAQQASELIIKSLTKEQHIRRFSNVSIRKFVDKIIEMGNGLYVVGLDIHTGFILNNNGHVWFIHSSYQPPLCVIKENALESAILTSSAYRVVGKISDDDELIRKWLDGERIITP